MQNSFWEKLKKPFFVLAPMADVTDTAFRRVIAKYGKPDVMWTEFVSADGLAHPVAREKLKRDLEYTEGERPIVAQLFGGNPEKMEMAARLCAELGFDGIDINMGCPDKTIEKQGAGAATIKSPELAKQIIEAARRGAIGKNKQALPVSVKTRIGFNKEEINTWIRFLLEQKLPALTVHLRTRKEMSAVPAHWELMPEIIKLRDEISPETLILGNGDIKDLEDAKEKAKQFKCDGVMLGRAIFGNPWLFSGGKRSDLKSPKRSDLEEPDVKEKLSVMVEHTKLFEELLGDIKSFSIMKKHYKAYVNGFDGAKELRVRLMEEATNASDVERIVNEFLK